MVFRHLIDAYRLSRNEVYQHEQAASDDSRDSSDDDAFEGFERFLRFAEMQPGLLPDCCTRDRCYGCRKLAVDKDDANSIYDALPTREALDYYVSTPYCISVMSTKSMGYDKVRAGSDTIQGDDTIKLRVLAEEVFRKGDFAIARSSQ